MSFIFFFFSLYGHQLYVYSFPTRRSSDLFFQVAPFCMNRLLLLKVAVCAFSTVRVSRTSPLPPLITIPPDRKSTRLNSSHRSISYAVFCMNTIPDPLTPPP